jgi:hypothetical protein
MLFRPNHASKYRLSIEDNAESQTSQGDGIPMPTSAIKAVRIQAFASVGLKSEFAPLVLMTASIAQ